MENDVNSCPKKVSYFVIPVVHNMYIMLCSLREGLTQPPHSTLFSLLSVFWLYALNENEDSFRQQTNNIIFIYRKF